MYNQYNSWGMNMGTPHITPKPRINWNHILSNTQKTLGIINQAIPLIYQLRPLISNAKTLIKIAGAMNDKTTKEENFSQETPPYHKEEAKEKDSSLQFFL